MSDVQIGYSKEFDAVVVGVHSAFFRVQRIQGRSGDVTLLVSSAISGECILQSQAASPAELRDRLFLNGRALFNEDSHELFKMLMSVNFDKEIEDFFNDVRRA